MLKSSGSWRVFISVLIAAGFACLAEVVDGANEFRRCYNTSVEMHCFTVQYDSNNSLLIASNDNARQRCRNLNSTLLIIKDEEKNNIVQNYISDPSNPIRSHNVWTDAYRINDYSNTYTWHWVNPKLPNLAASEVGYNAYIWSNDYYTTTLECKNESGKPPLQFYLTAKQPQAYYSYLCEYSVSRCSINASNVLQLSDRCYILFIASVPWYEARNRCLKDGGDLASFANVTSINFTSWLGSDPKDSIWIGLRFTWYIWKESGENVKFSNWPVVYNDWSLPCLTVCPNCNPSYSWLAKDCNAGDTRVVCHTVTPLKTTTLTTTSTTTLPVTLSADIKTQPGTTQSNNAGSNSSRIENRSGSRPIGVGVGVGVGVPVIVAIIVIVICVARRVTHKKQKTRSDNTKLEAVHELSVGKEDDSANSQYQQLNRNLENSSGAMYDELRISPETPSVGKVNDSANSQYEQLNRSVENSPGTTYDELRVSPETPYEEFPPQRS